MNWSGVKTGSDVVFPAKRLAGFKRIYDLTAIRQIFDPISHLRMGFKRQNLAVHPKIPDPLPAAERQGRQERVGIMQTQL